MDIQCSTSYETLLCLAVIGVGAIIRIGDMLMKHNRTLKRVIVFRLQDSDAGKSPLK